MKNLIKEIEQIANQHTAIKSVTVGDIFAVNGSADVKYPIFNLDILNSGITQNTNEHTFRFYTFDRTLDDGTDSIDIQSDMFKILEDVIRKLGYNSNYIVAPTIFNPFIQKFNDLCAGQYTDITVTIKSDYSNCDNPITISNPDIPIEIDNIVDYSILAQINKNISQDASIVILTDWNLSQDVSIVNLYNWDLAQDISIINLTEWNSIQDASITAIQTQLDSGSVQSVFGRSGDVSANYGDYTSDLIQETSTRVFVTPNQKGLIDTALQVELDPIFTASQAFNIDASDITNLGNLSGVNTGDQDLSSFVVKEPSKGLSTNDFTNTLKTKLDGIQDGAEVNVNANWDASIGDALILNKPDLSQLHTQNTDTKLGAANTLFNTGFVDGNGSSTSKYKTILYTATQTGLLLSIDLYFGGRIDNNTNNLVIDVWDRELEFSEDMGDRDIELLKTPPYRTTGITITPDTYTLNIPFSTAIPIIAGNKYNFVFYDGNGTILAGTKTSTNTSIINSRQARGIVPSGTDILVGNYIPGANYRLYGSTAYAQITTTGTVIAATGTEFTFNGDPVLTEETDPIFTASPAFSISAQDAIDIDNLSGVNTGDQDLSNLVIKNAAITGATKTKITYDSKGLVTSGVDATTADIADSSNKRYVTDAEKTTITHTNRVSLDLVSGTNTGDQDLSGYLPLQAIEDTKGLTGFVDEDNINVAYNYANRTITLTGDLRYYFRGELKELTSPWTSPAHTNVVGKYFLYSVDGITFSWSTTPWLFEHIQVAIAIFNSTAATSFGLRETHGTMDSESHQEFHNQIGTYRVSGGLATTGTYAFATATDAATTLGFDSVVIKDEDLPSLLPAWIEGTYTTMYVNGLNSVYSVTSSFPFLSSATYIQLNDPLTGTLTTGVANRFYNIYQILVPVCSDIDSQKYRSIFLQSQAEYTSLAAAQGENVAGLAFGSLTATAPELVINARITYSTSAANGNTGKVTIPAGGISYITGNRASQVSVVGFSTNNHSALSNLPWTSSGHIGTPNTIPAFNATGLASELGAASTSIDGYLLATDWIMFNAKQAALGFTPENIANKNQNNGYAGLDAGGKVALAQLPSTLLIYKGVWDASTNTPTLTTPDTTKKGFVYNVSVAGTQFGIAFSLGDWAIYNDSGVIEKSDNSDDVTSVNGQQGPVLLDTDDISDATQTNKYVTAAEKTAITHSNRSALDLVSGTNTGDETVTTIKSKLGITTLSGSNTGDQDLTGLVHTNRTALDLVSGTNTGDETKATIEAKLTGAITTHTHSYLPLAGGTMSNTNLVTNLNADLLDGQQGSYYAAASSLGSYLPLAGGNVTGNVNVSGNVGIGTTTPSSKLHIVADSTGNQLILERIGTATGKWRIYTDNNSLYFYDSVAGADRLTIASTGAATFSNKLSVTTSLSEDLTGVFTNSSTTGYGHAITAGAGTRYILRLADYAGTEKFIFRADGTSSFAGPLQIGVTGEALKLGSALSGNYNSISFKTANGAAQQIYTDYFGTNVDQPLILGTYANRGNQLVLNTNGTTTFASTVTATNFILGSDLRLKENITPISISNIDSVELKQFNLISDTEKRTRYGVIAQELELVAPEMVYTDKDGMKSVGYTDFLIAKIFNQGIVIKEQDNRIKDLESTLALVLERLNNLEGK